MNRKGFTLVELIAMMVVMGILMAIAIPNISGIIKNNRESIGIEDINKMVGNAEQKMQTGKAKYPKERNDCIVMTLNYINNNDDFKEGLNGGRYDMDESFIVISKKDVNGSGSTSSYKYYIRLVERKKNQTYVINLVDYDEFTKNPEDYTSKLYNFQENDKIKATTSSKIEIMNKINNMKGGTCNAVKEVYIN